MASILLIEEGPGVGRQLTSLVAAAGHRVLRCGGRPTPLAACPLLRHGRCPLPDAAQLLIFACPLGLPLRGRSYRGIHLLRAYRAHPNYGRLPLVLVAVAPPQDLEGPGSTELVDTFADSAAVLAAVNRLLQPTGHPPAPLAAGHHDADVGRGVGKAWKGLSIWHEAPRRSAWPARRDGRVARTECLFADRLGRSMVASFKWGAHPRRVR